MKVAFAGTPEFARLAYAAIVEAGFDVPLVLTQPDRASGRGMKLQPSAVKQEALQQGATILQPARLKRGPEVQAVQEALKEVDVVVVAAYGLIVPDWFLETPRYGCLNIHASLLPRWRGAAPIQRAIEAGDEKTGVCIMQMDEGLDTGAVLLQDELAIGLQNAAQLHDALAAMGARLIVEALGNLPELKTTPQPEAGVTYAHKLQKSEADLDFTQSAEQLARRVRAFNPFPGCRCMLPGFEQPVKVWDVVALPKQSQAAPGKVVSVSSEGIDIQTAQGVLRLLELQKAGSKRQPVSVFVQGWRNQHD